MTIDTTPAMMPIARTLPGLRAPPLLTVRERHVDQLPAEGRGNKASRSFSMELATVQTHRVRIIERGLVRELRAKARR